MGRQVPQDLAIVGHYDLPDARLAPVPLTTFDAKVDQLGQMAFSLLHERLSGRRDEPTQTRIEPRLIIRGSCGAAMRQPLHPESVS
jgi:DNA-binding LacI/PurR family transcriptional regulator